MEAETVVRHVEGLKICRTNAAIFIFGKVISIFIFGKWPPSLRWGCNLTTYLTSHMSLGFADSAISLTNLMEISYIICLAGVFICCRFYRTVKSARKAFLVYVVIQTMKNIIYQQGVERSRRERVEEVMTEEARLSLIVMELRLRFWRYQAKLFGQSLYSYGCPFDEVQVFIRECDNMLHVVRMLGAQMETSSLPMQTLNNNVEELSTITISVHHVNDVGKCPICIDDFVLGEEAIEMPCHRHHVFHSHCIRPWLQKQSTCPTCRREISVHKQK